MSKPSFVGGKFTLSNSIGSEVNSVDDIPFFAARRSLLLARYLASNIKAVRHYFPEVEVGIISDVDETEDHIALWFPASVGGQMAVHANSMGGAGMRCEAIGAGRAIYSHDIDDNDPILHFGFGARDIQMYDGRLVRDSTVRMLWKSACELSVEVLAVHQQLLERSGQA